MFHITFRAFLQAIQIPLTLLLDKRNNETPNYTLTNTQILLCKQFTFNIRMVMTNVFHKYIINILKQLHNLQIASDILI